MFTISKRFDFSASHQLEGLPYDHPCSRLHGHNYSVEAVWRSQEKDEVGFVLDYREMDRIKRMLDETYDHRHLNDVMGVNPTAENMALHFFQGITVMFPEKQQMLHKVRVSETPKTWAEYER